MKIKDFEHVFNDFGEFVNLNKNKLFRMWYKDEDEDESILYANYIYIIGCISIPNDIILLVQFYDHDCEHNKYPSVDYLKLSQISLTYYEDDQEEINTNK